LRQGTLLSIFGPPQAALFLECLKLSGKMIAVAQQQSEAVTIYPVRERAGRPAQPEFSTLMKVKLCS